MMEANQQYVWNIQMRGEESIISGCEKWTINQLKPRETNYLKVCMPNSISPKTKWRTIMYEMKWKIIDTHTQREWQWDGIEREICDKEVGVNLVVKIFFHKHQIDFSAIPFE